MNVETNKKEMINIALTIVIKAITMMSNIILIKTIAGMIPKIFKTIVLKGITIIDKIHVITMTVIIRNIKMSTNVSIQGTPIYMMIIISVIKLINRIIDAITTEINALTTALHKNKLDLKKDMVVSLPFHNMAHLPPEMIQQESYLHI